MPKPTAPASNVEQDTSEPKVEYAYRRLEEMIVTRELPPGSLVSEVQLANEIDVGRTPVREALARLKHFGFVETHPRRGTFVASVDVRKQLELLEVRRSLEGLIVSSACTRATSEERGEMKALADRIIRAAKHRDVHEYFQVNRAIHELEVAAAHNSMLTTTMQIIHAQSRRFWFVHVQQTGAFEEAAARHAEVLRSIAKGDQAEAVHAGEKLMQFLDALTRSAFDTFR
ncbi:GntR family transcriptional regulator [Caballeronia hypogeia]|uniref:GntR family transcriptional regulator n=1 Tax=Caballeronia hypogeia TaxID=1777140 RepID=A0A158CW73_9BURK|nr:GntR family transcriptional regulator [Caballeronia hypogeia]SAK86501.1 GntR family transcriptional regulator [Caballeronia hypogeia]